MLEAITHSITLFPAIIVWYNFATFHWFRSRRVVTEMCICFQTNTGIQSGHCVPVISYTYCFISRILGFFIFSSKTLIFLWIVYWDIKKPCMTRHLCQYLVDLKKKLETGVTKFKFILQVLTLLFLNLLIKHMQHVLQTPSIRGRVKEAAPLCLPARLWIVVASECFPHLLPGVSAQVLQMTLRVSGDSCNILLHITHIMGCCTADFYLCMVAMLDAHLKTSWVTYTEKGKEARVLKLLWVGGVSNSSGSVLAVVISRYKKKRSHINLHNLWLL